MTVPYRELLLETADGVMTLTMNRPEKRNALSARLVGELITALRAADEDDAVRAVVITGSGGAFCAGADLSLLGGGGDYDDGFVSPGGFPELNLTLRGMGTPTIVRIERYALAGGLALVCNATFAIAEEGARFAAPEIDRGLFPMMVLASLFRTVSRKDGMDIVLTGRSVLAPEAQQMGLINRSVPADALDSTVTELAATLAAKPPGAMRLGLKAIEDQEAWDFETALSELQVRLFEALQTDEARAGIEAFLKKRAQKA
jgi:enoyl-CoA hydratase/carnithine racemase